MSQICPSCQRANRDDARHCGGCGTALSGGGYNSPTGYCPSGKHPMDPGWDTCPYCSEEDMRGPSGVGRSATVPESGMPLGKARTAVENPLGGGAKPSGPTHTDGRVGGSLPPPPPPPNMRPGAAAGPRKRGETVIAPVPVPGKPMAAGVQPAAKARERKIVGILISYTWNPAGVLHPVREGRTIIGRDPSCDICVPEDPHTSGSHAVIIYRQGVFLVDDENTQNGTQMNGEEVIEKTRMPSGSKLQTGATTWLFMSLEQDKETAPKE